jgi:hypothetical protein
MALDVHRDTLSTMHAPQRFEGVFEFNEFRHCLAAFVGRGLLLGQFPVLP